MGSRGLVGVLALAAMMGLVTTATAAPFAYLTMNDNGTGKDTGNTVVVVDLENMQPVGNPIVVGTGPFGIAVAPDGLHAYVANRGNSTVSPTVSVIDTTTNTVVPDAYGNLGAAVCALNNSPDSIAINPAGTDIYVVCNPNGEIWNLSTKTCSNNPTQSCGTDADCGAGSCVWAVGAAMKLLDSNRNSTFVTGGTMPGEAVVTPDGSHLWVASNGSGDVTVINLSDNSHTRTGVGLSPIGVAVLPNGKTVYVANHDSSSVSVISTSNPGVVATTILLPDIPGIFGPIPAQPKGIVASYDGNRVYLATQANIEWFDTATNTAHIAWGPGGGTTWWNVDINPEGNQVLIPVNTPCNIFACPPPAAYLLACDPADGCRQSPNIPGYVASFGHFLTPLHSPPVPPLDTGTLETTEKNCLNAITNNAQSYADTVIGNFQKCFSQSTSDNLLIDWTNGKGLLLADSVCWSLLDPTNASNSSGVARKRASASSSIYNNCSGLTPQGLNDQGIENIATIGSPCGITDFANAGNDPWHSNSSGYYGIIDCVLDQAQTVAQQMILTAYGPSPHVCSGGTNSGASCQAASDCPGGSCVVQSDGHACQLTKAVGLEVNYPMLCQ